MFRVYSTTLYSPRKLNLKSESNSGVKLLSRVFIIQYLIDFYKDSESGYLQWEKLEVELTAVQPLQIKSET